MNKGSFLVQFDKFWLFTFWSPNLPNPQLPSTHTQLSKNHKTPFFYDFYNLLMLICKSKLLHITKHSHDYGVVWQVQTCNTACTMFITCPYYCYTCLYSSLLLSDLTWVLKNTGGKYCHKTYHRNNKYKQILCKRHCMYVGRNALYGFSIAFLYSSDWLSGSYTVTTTPLQNSGLQTLWYIMEICQWHKTNNL